MLEEEVLSIRLGQEQMCVDKEQRFSQLENLIAMMLKGKGTAEVGDSSAQTSTTRMTRKPLLIEQPTLTSKKIETPNFDGTNPIGWI